MANSGEKFEIQQVKCVAVGDGAVGMYLFLTVSLFERL